LPDAALGDIPESRGPSCLEHKTPEACSVLPQHNETPYNRAERRAAAAVGDTYVNPFKWFCLSRCSPVIGSFEVYADSTHVTAVYSEFLEGVLAQSLGI